jgi:tRNA pseudouridine55 synthase
MDGILLVDKPPGKTSHDVVDEVRRRLCTRRVGHAGTLDPMATGLLVIGVGRALRLLEYLQAHDKEYLFAAKLGVRTDTDDADGRAVGETAVPSREALEAALESLRGRTRQVPPAYSSVKVAGRKLYQYAREGREVPQPERAVRIDLLELLSYEPPLARFRVRGSKGLYVRSLARDLGGHVVELRRLASGPFRVEEAGPDLLLPMETAVRGLPEHGLSEEEARSFRCGRPVPGPAEGPDRRVYLGSVLVGIGRPSPEGLRPRKVLTP